MKKIFTIKHIKIYCCILAAIVIFQVSAKGTPTVQWSNQAGTAENDGWYAIAIDSQDNIITVGGTSNGLYGTSAGETDAIMAKYDSAGNQLWTKQFGTAEFDKTFGVAVDTSGNIYVTGSTDGNLYGTNAGESDVFLTKFSSSGAFIWGRQFGTEVEDYARGIAVDSSGKPCVVGDTSGDLYGSNNDPNDVSAGLPDTDDGFVVKYDANGNKVWGTQFGDENDDSTSDICVDSQDNVYVAGTTYTFGGVDSKNIDAMIVKISSSGSVVWSRQFGSADYDSADNVKCSGNSVYVGGTMNSVYNTIVNGTNGGDDDSMNGYIAAYSSSGNSLWLTQMSNKNGDGVTGIALDSQGNIYATGSTSGTVFGTNAGDEDIILAKYNSSGNLVWGHQFGTTADDGASGVVVNSQGKICLAGGTDGNLYGTNSGKEDCFIVQFTP